MDIHLLVNLESVDTCSSMWLPSLEKLKVMHLPDVDFLDDVNLLAPAGALQAVTHIAGRLPPYHDVYTWGEFFADPAGWMRSLLDNLPAVTHLGLTIYLQQDSEYSKIMAISQFNPEAIGTTPHTGLQESPRIQSIAFRICGPWAEKLPPELETVPRMVGDSRVKAWFDLRP